MNKDKETKGSWWMLGAVAAIGLSVAYIPTYRKNAAREEREAVRDPIQLTCNSSGNLVITYDLQEWLKRNPAISSHDLKSWMTTETNTGAPRCGDYVFWDVGRPDENGRFGLVSSNRILVGK